MLELVVGAVLAVAGGVVGTYYGSTREQKAWLRNMRREAYAEFAQVLIRADTELVLSVLFDRSAQGQLSTQAVEEVAEETGLSTEAAATQMADASMTLGNEVAEMQWHPAAAAVAITAALAAVQIAGPSEVFLAANAWWTAVGQGEDTVKTQLAFTRAARKALGTGGRV